MKQWYRLTATKAAVFIAGILGGAALFTSAATAVIMAGTVNPAELLRLVGKPYEESPDFTMAVEDFMYQSFDKFRLEDLFETEGVYNPAKIIDIMQLSEKRSVDGENRSGVAYGLEDLTDWSEDFINETGEFYEDNGVVVCQKPDGTYYYYYTNDFLSLFEAGSMTMEFEDEYQSQQNFLRGLENGDASVTGTGSGVKIYDAEGELLYTDCWGFGRSVREKYAPVGAENLLQAVNESQKLNGKLTLIYDRLATALAEISSSYETYRNGWEYLEEGNTNFTFLYVDGSSRQVRTNKSEYMEYENAEQSIEDLKSGGNVKYMIVYPQLKNLDTNMDVSSSTMWDSVRSYDSDRDFDSIFAAAVDTSFPVRDQFYESRAAYDSNIPVLGQALVFLFLGAAVFLAAVIWLGVTAGMKPGAEQICLTSFDRWKTEIAAASVIACWIIGNAAFLSTGLMHGFEDLRGNLQSYTNIAESGGTGFYSMIVTGNIGLYDVAGLYLYGAFTCLCFFAGYVSLVRRIKAKILWSGSLLSAVLSFGKSILQARTTTMKAVFFILAFLLSQWMAVLTADGFWLLLALAADCAAFWFVMTGAIAKDRICRGIEEIASGNLEYQIELKGLRGFDRELAEKVNDIGNGLNRAVDEAMRNERLKTDLITNVSHDIKTPLTSIINYVDILKRSDIADEKIRGYLDILEAKAQRLKTLTEDVVEASKVSSGNITLEYMDVDLRELIQQTEGELTEKFAARDLSVVINMPEEPAVIHVDGRRMWRVLENIFVNAAKYAMPGTRVYADLLLTGDRVMFSLKNVSEQQLNISADELTERFIRGDISRSTEGSGLGLSIAKSLTTMQGGTFVLYLDGDLFKVNIEFPRVIHHVP